MGMLFLSMEMISESIILTLKKYMRITKGIFPNTRLIFQIKWWNV